MGRYRGRKIRYHKKYCDVQTLLKVTKASVWARSVVDNAYGVVVLGSNGSSTVERRSCGRKASRSAVNLEVG